MSDYRTIGPTLVLRNHWVIFNQILYYDADHMTKMAAMPGTSGPISTKLGMLYQGLRLFKLLAWVDLDQFFGKVKFCKLGFYIEKCDSDGSLEIIAAFDLDIG